MDRLGRIYVETRERIIEVVTDGRASEPVPACPEWTVHDVLAHLSGLCVDIVTGRLTSVPDDVDDLSARQVDERKLRTKDDVIAEWRDFGGKMAETIDVFPGRYGPQLVADVNVHEHDIRGALGQPGSRASEGIDVAIEYLVDAIVQPAFIAFGLDPLELHIGDRAYVVASDGPATYNEDQWKIALTAEEPHGKTVAVGPSGLVTIEPFEFFRAVTGRRSAAQIQAYDWRVGPEPYLRIFGFGPFRVRAEDLIE